MSLPNASNTDHIWTSPQSLKEPSAADIVTFTFANLGQYEKNKPIFIDAKDPTQSVSASQAISTMRQLVNGLKDLGVKEGDCVCLHAFNNIWYPLIWLAIIGSGAIVSPINPAYTSLELERHLRLTHPRLIFTQRDCFESIEEAASRCGIPNSHIFLIENNQEQNSQGCPSWKTLLAENEEHDPVPLFEPGRSLQGRLAVYALTSGTTGLPKAAMIPHQYVVAQAAALESEFIDRDYQPSQLICLPVFHAFASPLALVLPLRLGMPTYFLPKFNLSDFLLAVSKFGITDTPIVPPILGTLAHLSEVEIQHLQSLRYVICAGASLNPRVQEKLASRLHKDANVAQCWGTTEAGWHALLAWKEKDTSGSVGRLLPGVELKLLDDHGHSIGDEEQEGDALIRAPALFSGYIGDVSASFEAFNREGFYRTGDRAFIRGGKLYYTGRRKEIMKVNGWQVSPTEVENVLAEHPLIDDAAVYGEQSENVQGICQTLLCAYVVRRSLETVSTGVSGLLETPKDERAGHMLNEQDVMDLVASRLISYKHLKRVSFVKKIPRSPTGKILRWQLDDVEVEE
ncbi:hypothetical protein PV08_08810 [Exophiala spinifera]|uniref:AMP-dependent synthetase/ligase domain-containing protein n=1 Tax=Exophiala spinifera TaxID=91928 RepID=A0A0D2BR02_9EURO|nr:uncharacterized protein PV08_08810 [Exophiala spinifera]KIW13619.1 hypothetical protein PV08_08810 [Exophiala spinifera]